MTYPNGGAGQIWRDGTGGAHNPSKQEIREWGEEIQNRLNDTLSVMRFGAVGDGIADDTVAIQAAISAAMSANSRLAFPKKRFKFSDQLVFTGIDVDFGGCELYYTGPTGQFAVVLDGRSGASVTQTNGNSWTGGFTLYQDDFSEYETYSASVTYDPPSIPTYSNFTNITPDYNGTTVSVPGARAGGYVLVNFDQLVDGVTVTGRVTADDEVTVYFNSFRFDAVDLSSGTLDVTVINNAYHGLNIGGTLASLKNAKVRGFTGVSVGVGSGDCDVSGLSYPAAQQAYYCEIDVNTAAAAGWGMIVKPRNNENKFNFSSFNGNYYGDYRACYINKVVLSGLTNIFEKLSLEGNSTGPSLVLSNACAHARASSTVYWEQNTQFPSAPLPHVHALPYSGSCRMQFFMVGPTGKIKDEGTANVLEAAQANFANPQAQVNFQSPMNLVKNGDFQQGQVAWDLFGSGTNVVSFPGPGVFTGLRARVNCSPGKGNLQQEVDRHSLYNFAALGQGNVMLTAGCWLKTNMSNITLRLNGIAAPPPLADEEWHYMTARVRLDDVTSTLDLSIISTTSEQTGYFEFSDVTLAPGLTPLGMAPSLFLEGSVAYDPPNLTTGSVYTTTMTVPGAQMGDFVILGHSRDLQECQITGYVTAADTVEIVLANMTGADRNVGSGTLKARVMRNY